MTREPADAARRDGTEPPMALRPLALIAPLVLCAAGARAEGFDFAALEALVQGRQIRSVEDLVPALPATLRYRYALVFSSRSLQGASYLNPRVVMYGTDARFVLTFNGEATQRGFASIETLEFVEATRSFRLREIAFAPPPGAPVQVSEVNPERCLRCHGTPARPVWDTHPAWPGAYGERYGSALSAAERAGIEAFLARQPTHPRYRALLGAGRFADPETFRPGARTRYGGTASEPPNEELSGLLATLSSRAIVRELSAREGFRSYRYALLGASEASCGGVEDFFPQGRSRALAAMLRSFAANTASANAREAEMKVLRLEGARRGAAHIGDDAALTGLRFLAESALGVPTREWTLALEKGSYDFTAPPVAAGALRRALLEELAPEEPALVELSAYATPADGDRFCNYLRRRSRAALASLPPPVAPALLATAPAAATPDRPAALGLCIACHQSDVAPPIAFADEPQLARALRGEAPGGPRLADVLFRLSPQSGARRMPLGLNLAEAERAELAAYFRALAGGGAPPAELHADARN